MTIAPRDEDIDATFFEKHEIGADRDPDDVLGHWKHVRACLDDIFNADPDIHEVRFDLTEAVTDSWEQFPTSCRFRYFDKDRFELSISVLSCNAKLAQAAWVFEQTFVANLEGALFDLSRDDPSENSIWSLIFLRGAALVMAPGNRKPATIFPLFQPGASGHDRLQAMQLIAGRFTTEETGGAPRALRSAVSAAEHDRRGPVMLKMELQSAVALLRTHNIIKVPEVTKMLKMITRRSKTWK